MSALKVSAGVAIAASPSALVSRRPAAPDIVLASSTPHAPLRLLVVAKAREGMAVIEAIRTKLRGDSPSVPIVIGHRGFAARAPENTLISYQKALELGARFVECDVHLSKDGVPVVIHDAELARTTSASGRVGDKTVQELKVLDAGRWKSPEFAGEKIPTLAELLALTRERAVLAIELKDPTIEPQVLDVIRKNASVDDVIMFAWVEETLARARAIEPDLVTLLLIKDTPADVSGRQMLFARAQASAIDILGVRNFELDAELFRDAHAAGLKVFVWTVNSGEDMRRLARWGADGIITDFPDIAQRVLAE
jgi:glycerophosphoryl diester phosphodiesterase